MHSMAPSPCFFIISRARSIRYLRSRSQLTRCCQSMPAMPKFAPIKSSRRFIADAFSRAPDRKQVDPSVSWGVSTRAQMRSAPLTAGIGLQSRRFDAGNGAGFVLVGGVAGNPDRADDVAGGIADQDAAGIGDDAAAARGVKRIEELRRVGG